MVHLTLGVVLLMFAAAATAYSHSVQECRSARDFIEALYNPNATSIEILQNISLTDADWKAYAVPVVLQRSVNVSGKGDSNLKWPVVDLGFVAAKVMLATNVTLSFTRVVLWNWRKGPEFQAPGIDLIATNEGIANQNWDPLYPNLRFHDMIWIQRGCMAAYLGQSLTRSLRPSFVPGNQSLTDALPQPDCVNSSAAPMVQRCWPMAFEYQDVVVYGYNVEGLSATPRRAGYLLWLQNTPVRCEAVLDEDCVKRYDVIGCFYTFFPNVASSPPPLQLDDHSDGLTGSNTTRSEPAHRAPGGAILGGVLGGVTFLAAVGGVLAAAMIVRRRRRQLSDKLRAPKSGQQFQSSPDGLGCAPLQVPSASLSKSASSECEPLPGRPPSRTQKDPGMLKNDASKGHTDRAKYGDKVAPGSTDIFATARPQQSFLSALRDASSAAPVTPRTPLQPDVNLRLSLGTGEVAMLPGVIGKGTFGRVVPGRYAGQQVAVKLLDYGLLLQCRGGAGGGGAGGHGHNVAAAAAQQLPNLSMVQVLSFEAGTQGPAAAPLPEPQAPSAGGGGSSGSEAVATLTVSVGIAAGDWQQDADAKAGSAGARAKRNTSNGFNPEDADAEKGDWGACSRDDGAGGIGDGGDVSSSGSAPAAAPAAAGAAIGVYDDEAHLHLTDPGQRGLVQEVEVLARCRHPNIVRLLAACLRPPHMCLVMELMETSLDRLMYGAGPGNPLMPLAKVLHIGLQVAVGLEYLHPTVMHRDLKPGNVLLQNAASPTPIVKLADFGLSRLQTSVLVTANVGVGTVAYMAPETLSAVNCVITHHVDIYALGVILWELLAGVRPWAGLDIVQIAVAVEMRRERPPLEVLPAERCPPKLRALIQRCWDRVPERRPAAAEVVKELLQLQQMLTITNDNKLRQVSSVGTSQHLSGSIARAVTADDAFEGATAADGLRTPPSIVDAAGAAGAGAAGAGSAGAGLGAPGRHPVGNQVAALAWYHPSRLPPPVASVLRFAEC